MYNSWYVCVCYIGYLFFILIYYVYLEYNKVWFFKFYGGFIGIGCRNYDIILLLYYIIIILDLEVYYI